MIRTHKYRAYNEVIDHWEYFTIDVSTVNYTITWRESKRCVRCFGTLDEVHKAAFDELTQIVKNHHFTKLTKVEGDAA